MLNKFSSADMVDLDELEKQSRAMYLWPAFAPLVTELRYHREREAAGGWIRCEERMPEADTRVLVFGDPYDTGSAVFEAFQMPNFSVTHRWQFRGGCYCHESLVSHWMPLPSPPEAT